MKTDIWMPLYIGDYLAATQHLSCEESGAYLHLLMHQWKNGPLPGNTELLRRIARCEQNAWSNAWSILQAFFKHCSDGSYVQERLERERVEWDSRRARNVEKAALAASKRWKNAPSNAPSIASSIPQAMPETCPSPSPSPSQVNTNTKAVGSEPSGSLPAIPPVAKLPTNRKGEYYPVANEDLETFARLYPAVNVMQELRKMEGWLVANPARAKTLKGMPRFINSWLAEEQNKPRVISKGAGSRPDATVGVYAPGIDTFSSDDDPGEIAKGFWKLKHDTKPDEFTRTAPPWAREMFGEVRVGQ